MVTGRCECGSVRFSLPEVRASVTVCHCSQCRRTSGHVWASTMAPADSLTFETKDGLTWIDSSDFAKRGFCNRCGSSLFYKMQSESEIAISAGSLDDDAGLVLGQHIYVKDKGCYYEIPAHERQIERY